MGGGGGGADETVSLSCFSANDRNTETETESPLYDLDVALVNVDLELFSEDQEGPVFDHVTVPRARKVMHKIMLGLHGDLGGEQTFAYEKSFMIFVCPQIRAQVRGVPEVTLRKLLTRGELVGLLAVDVAMAGSR